AGIELVEVGDEARARSIDARRVRIEREHRELVSSEPRDDVRAAERFAEDVARFAKSRVASIVPERVVDRLQAVEVDEEERDGATRAPGNRELVRCQREECSTIAKAGELVDER